MILLIFRQLKIFHILPKSFLHLLFVDDDTDTCAQAYALFSPLFHSVTLTHDTTSAMSHLINHDIDLIMTDIEMPNESGLSFIEKVRCSHPSLPIVILSAYAEKDYLFKAANLSIDGYLMKPIRQRTLTPILQKISLRFPLLSLDHQLGEAVFYESNSHILTVDNCPTSLGKKETLLLELLLKNKTGLSIDQIATALVDAHHFSSLDFLRMGNHR